MARKRSITKETLSAPRRCSPRLLPNNPFQHFNPNPKLSSTKLVDNDVSKNPNPKIIGTITPTKLRRSARLAELKKKQENPINGNDHKSSCGVSYTNLSNENLYKRVTRSASLRNRRECGEGSGYFGCIRGENRFEDVGGGGCKNEGLRNVEESRIIGRRVTRSVSRNGSEFERNCNVDCKGGGNLRFCEVLGGGGFENEKSKRVVEECMVIGKRVTRRASVRNGRECERNCNVDCKGSEKFSFLEVVDGGGLKDERSKRVVEGSIVIAKRVTRSASLGRECEERNGYVECNARDNCSLSKYVDGRGFKDEKSKRVMEESTQIHKRVTRSASRRNGSEDEERKGNVDCNAKDNSLLSEELNGWGFQNEKSERVDKSLDGNEKEENVGKKQPGQKRKNEQKGECDGNNGWTKEQQAALRRAYFDVKPTPDFWKKVAKMVPGKSAQDCFDRIHSDLKTPQTKKQSRAKRATPSFSASKLLSSVELKGTRRSKFSKRKRHLAQKTVRQLLQKQVHVNKDGADLFAILENTVDPFNESSQHCIPCPTPKQTERGLNLLNICQETSSTAHRKLLSRLSNSSGASSTSPPVLKQIKNKALHEKYIDQLHCREAKRRASVARFQKQVKSNNEDVGNDGAVKAARNALFFDATDAMKQFQLSQMGAVDSDICDDEIPFSDDDESENNL